MLAEHCGSVHRAPISYVKKMASLRASDTVLTPSPLWRKIVTTEYWFQTWCGAHSVLWTITFRHWDPLHRQSSLWQKQTARSGLALWAMASIFSGTGDLPV